MIRSILTASPGLTGKAIAFVRIIVGLMLVYHGWEVFDRKVMEGYATWDQFKSNSSPMLRVYLGKGSELVAGILLTLGLFTRLAAIILIITLGYIAFFVGHGKVWYEDQHPFMFVLFGLLFFFTGPGSWSMDNKIFKLKTSSSVS